MSDDLRLGDLITKIDFHTPLSSLSSLSSLSNVDIGIIGFPYDIGVLRNNGRVGSKNGPNVIRNYINRLGTLVNPEYNIDIKNLNIVDCGDVPSGIY